MSDGYNIKKEIDEDYIDPPKRRAIFSTRGSDESEECDELEDGDAHQPPPAWHGRGMEMTHLYNAESEWSFGDDIDQDAPVEQVREPGTRTAFDYREAADTERWKRLRRIQDGAYTRSGKSRGSQNSEAERKRTIQTFAGHLDCTTFQKERATAIMEEIKMTGTAHYTTRTVALAIISLVANEDGRWIRDEGQFRALMRDCETSLKDMRKCRKLLKRKSDIL